MERSGSSQTNRELPASFAFGPDGLTYEGALISTYCPVVVTVKNYVNGDKLDPHVTLAAILGDGTQTPEITIPLRDLKRLDFQTDLDHRCYDYSDNARSFVQRLIRYLVTQRQAVKVYRANTLGFLHYKDRVAYNAGSRLIGDLGIDVEITTKGYGFYSPDDLSNEQLGVHIKNIIQLEPSVTAPLFSYFILGLLRDVFHEAGVPIHFCLYVVGAQQSFKTTLSTNLCSLYDRDKDVEMHLHNLTASEAMLHRVLSLEKDMVTIIDDLNHDDSKKRERDQERKLSVLIRTAANDVGHETLRERSEINAQALFCGEYLLKNTSTLSRLLIVHVEQGQIDKAKLLTIQQNPDLLTGFAERFISWVIANYQTLCGFISEQDARFRKIRAEGVPYHERLNRSASVLTIAYEILLEFCKTIGWDLGLSNQGFSTIMENLLYRQLEDMKLQEQNPVDYVVEVFEFLQLEIDCGLVKEGRPKDKFWKKPIYYDDYLEQIFIKGEEMGQISLEISKKLKGSISIRPLLDALDAEGIVITDNNKNGTRSKKVGGQRCYVLDYARMKQYVQEQVNEYEEKQYQDENDHQKYIIKKR